MGLPNSGRDHIAAMIVGDSAAPWNNANAKIGVGNTNTAFNASQTDLLGSSTLRKGMDVGFPQRAPNLGSGTGLTFRSTFETGEANFAWEEWGVFTAITGGTMLNRKVESLGTKTSAQSWQITCGITVANP